MAPMYVELAEALASEPNLVIGEMDATANEVDGVNIQGFPTIKFYPANNKTPVDFSGDRTLDGFLGFLRDSTSRAVTFDFETLLGGGEEGEGDEGEDDDEAEEED